MSSISPNDPVVQMLKQVVNEFQGKVNEVTEAMEALMQGTGAAIQNLNTRIIQLEAKLAIMSQAAVREDTGGKEL